MKIIDSGLERGHRFSRESYFPEASPYVSCLQEAEASCSRVNGDYSLFDTVLIPVKSSMPVV